MIVNRDIAARRLAVPKFNIDTEPTQPNATAAISFVASAAGNCAYIKPHTDCGGGSCNANASLVGWFLVKA